MAVRARTASTVFIAVAVLAGAVFVILGGAVVYSLINYPDFEVADRTMMNDRRPAAMTVAISGVVTVAASLLAAATACRARVEKP
jgi:hypothetical protein